jgi:hypothetical protein
MRTADDFQTSFQDLTKLTRDLVVYLEVTLSKGTKHLFPVILNMYH